MGSIGSITASLVRFPSLIAGHSLHLRTNRKGAIYNLPGRGLFTVFRETVSTRVVAQPVVLVVGFRLRAIGTSAVLHRLFQHVCVLTTPFWSGFQGFGTKLWMVDQRTKNYVGIYQWDSVGAANNYLQALIPVLKAVSVRGSVWSQSLPGRELEDFLSAA